MNTNIFYPARGSDQTFPLQRRMIIRLSFSKFLSKNALFPSDSSRGFTLVEMIGVLAILAILTSFIAPNVINRLKTAGRDAEIQQLTTIGKGIELYIRQTRTFPSVLSDLSPDYVPISLGQLNANPNGFPRYFVLQPNLAGFTNAAGLDPTILADARFLLISDLSQDANPAIATDMDFEGWWNTDETAFPDLKIHRGHLGPLFHLLNLSGSGAGGSYTINGTATDSGGAVLITHLRYHLAGTPVGLDEDNSFTAADLQLTITGDMGYQFDPDCPVGSKWRVTSSGCYAP